MVVLAAALALVLAPAGRGVRELRLAIFDAYQYRMPRERVSAPAVIVEIDEKSLAQYGQWPWPRTRLARLIDLIAEGRPAAIGLDIVMPEPDRLSPDRLAALLPQMEPDVAARLTRLPSNDALLAATVRDRPVVLGVAGLEDSAATATAGRHAPVRIAGGGDLRRVRVFPGTLRSVETIDAAAEGHGLLSVDVEGGVVRRVPAIARVADDWLPGFAVELFRVAAGAPGLTVRTSARGIEAVVVGDLVVPTQPDGSVWIRYTRSDRERFVSAADVLAGRVAPARFTRRLVLVGVTTLGISDYKATPVDDRMPGVEIHTQLIEGIFDGALLSRPRWAVWAEAAALAIGGAALIVAVPAVSALASTGIAAVLALAVVGLGIGAFAYRGLLLDPGVPVLGIGAVFTVMLGVTLAEAESQRRALRRQVIRQREEAARLAGELEAARRIQMGSLPTPAAAFPGETRFELYAYLEPAREVGGDLYDFFRLDADRAFLLVGDVSGKGLPGSLFMTVSKSLCKSVALRLTGDVGAMMREADREIARDNAEGLFVTVWAAILDASTGALEFGSAGHDAPYLLNPGREAPRQLATEGGGPPFCVMDDFPYDGARDRMRRGEMLCLATDGVTEATNAAGELYGRARLEALLAGLPADASARDVGEAIRRDVVTFSTGVEPADDVALVVLKWIGP